ncbi:MAG TPA: CDP-alcohol phosphatidyltransferase family protein [Candidatus Thermoplasmatota archaeon]|nr:CDP-alcohol phosphatidyltransferase family protein [Candidatus Thermoplasmatota archaeon]
MSADAVPQPPRKRYSPMEEEILFKPFTRPLARALARTPLTPNQVTAIGFLVAAAAACVVAFVYPRGTVPARVAVALALYVSFFFDKLDGDLARAKGTSSPRGAYLDSFLDRLSEVVLFAGILVATGFSNPYWVAAAAIGPILYWSHLYMYWHYSAKGEKSFFPTERSLARNLKNLITFTRAKYFLLLIVLTLAGSLEWSIYILALLIPYTMLLFVPLFFRTKPGGASA